MRSLSVTTMRRMSRWLKLPRRWAIWPRSSGGTLASVPVHRRVGVAVYESHEAAILAVEAWRKDIASPVKRGPHERSGTTDWWFGESQACLAIVQDNVVFIALDLDRRYSAASVEL